MKRIGHPQDQGSVQGICMGGSHPAPSTLLPLPAWRSFGPSEPTISSGISFGRFTVAMATEFKEEVRASRHVHF